MYRFACACIAFSLAGLAAAQTTTLNRPFVQASGNGTVSVRPDLLKMSIAVNTQARTAKEAAELNATRVTEVLTGLRQLLGASSDIKTIAYTVNPNYRTDSGTVQTIAGYTAINTVQVTTADLSAAGRIIDVAAKSGSNTVSRLEFTLADPGPARQDALKLAAKQARAQVEAMAQALNVRIGSILAVQESFVSSSVDTPTISLSGNFSDFLLGAPAPVSSSTTQMGASVTLQAEIIQ